MKVSCRAILIELKEYPSGDGKLSSMSVDFCGLGRRAYTGTGFLGRVKRGDQTVIDPDVLKKCQEAVEHHREVLLEMEFSMNGKFPNFNVVSVVSPDA